MMRRSPALPTAWLRLFAMLVAASAWTALSMSFGATLSKLGSAGAASWVMVRYFSFWVDLAVAISFTGLTVQTGWTSPAIAGGIALNASVMAIVYGALPSGGLELSGRESLADALLHDVTPALVVLFWLIGVPRGSLRYRDMGPWIMAPLLYFAGALAWGGADGTYPYPFMDVSRIGWGATASYAALIAVEFLALGFGLVWFDRRWPRSPSPS